MIVIPIGLFFALQREKLLEKCLGWMVVFGGIVGIFASGSRGAYMGFLASTAVFLLAWPIRRARMSRISLAPAFVGVAGALSFAAVVLLIEVSPTVHNHVLGGGAEAASNEGRRHSMGGRFAAHQGKSDHGARFRHRRLTISARRSTVMSSRCLLRRAFLDLCFSPGSWACPFGLGSAITFTTCRSRARFQVRWLAALSRSRRTGLLCRNGRTTC